MARQHDRLLAAAKPHSRLSTTRACDCRESSLAAVVSHDKPVAFSFTRKADKTVRYDGAAVELKR